MSRPQPAPVRPRVISPHTGETLLLEDWIEPLLRTAEAGAVCIHGPFGSGKTTALAHLAARFPRPAVVVFLDEPDADEVEELRDHVAVVYTAREPLRVEHRAVAELAPWGEDERLEYLMAAHRDRCGSVMERVRAALELEGSPENAALWRVCLDRMAEDGSITSFVTAVELHVDVRFRWGQKAHARRISLAALLGPTGTADAIAGLFGLRALLAWLSRPLDSEQKRFLRHPSVRLLLAAQELARELRRRRPLSCLRAALPRPLLAEVGRRLAGDRKAQARLERRLAEPASAHPMVASLLHASGSGWTPERTDTTQLRGGVFPAARWTGFRLPNLCLEGADLTNAVLTDASLRGLWIRGAGLRGARLCGSSLPEAKAEGADLTGADLSQVTAQGASFAEADLTGARLCRADFRQATLAGATIFEADFSGANLESASLTDLDLRSARWEGTRFARANLHRCRLDHMRLPGAIFEEAILTEALLTGSFMPGGNLARARLQNAKLGDVDWPFADLREADLRGASFHMGSTRSGLVFNAPPLEGSRTGFYTDDYDDQSYRAPEEIRKANLRGADLRGAKIDGVDFYLVDLRDARYTADQEGHFRRCGAILSVRV